MSFNILSNYVIYIFQKFRRIFKIDRRPEYTKVEEDDDDEIDYDKLNDSDEITYSFVFLKS